MGMRVRHRSLSLSLSRLSPLDYTSGRPSSSPERIRVASPREAPRPPGSLAQTPKWRNHLLYAYTSIGQLLLYFMPKPGPPSSESKQKADRYASMLVGRYASRMYSCGTQTRDSK